MRIITGKARGVKLRTLEGENTRPTAERTKEAIFSMIQFEIEGKRVLDAFAGSGQMGLEAVSRGALSATLIDENKSAIEIIKKNSELARLKDSVKIIHSKHSDYLNRISGSSPYDIVFLDPPYDSKLIEEALTCLIKNKLVKSSATIICESNDVLENKIDVGLLNKFDIVKSAKYGIAHVTILKMKEHIDD